MIKFLRTFSNVEKRAFKKALCKKQKKTPALWQARGPGGPG